jgi:hypothetical protein
MNCCKADSCKLLNRVQELEEKINHLRVSRRVLLGLLEKVHQENNELLEKMANENLMLKQKNINLAKKLFANNIN